MKTKILLASLFILLVSIQLYSQKKIINKLEDAQHIIDKVVQKKQVTAEPQWKMNFYFEDGTGTKDTLTIGYDPSANTYVNDGLDTEFGEEWEVIDTTQFNVYLKRNNGTIYHEIMPPPIDTDIVLKTEIKSWLYPNMEIGWVHGELPLVMYWDDEKLYDSALPSHYIDLPDPYPSAVMELWFDSGWHSMDDVLQPECMFFVGSPPMPNAILTDYPTIETPYEWCVFNDAMWWWEGGYEIGAYMRDELSLILVPYQEHFSVIGTEDINLPNYTCYPNPTTDFITIESNETALHYRIYDVLGKEHLNGTTNQRIDLQSLPAGIYFIKINNQIQKIIKK